jgi:hypothetical protein
MRRGLRFGCKLVLLSVVGHRKSQRSQSKGLVSLAHVRIRSPENLKLDLVNSERQIVPGVSVSPSGQATIEPSIKAVLFDLAFALEEPTNLPVDIEHVVAALVLAARNDEIDSNKEISARDYALISVLTVHVKAVFAFYVGRVGSDK